MRAINESIAVARRGLGRLLLPALLTLAPLSSSAESMRELVERFTADYAALRRSVAVEGSEGGRRRLGQFLTDGLHALRRVDFGGLDLAGRVDWLLLKNHLAGELEDLELGSRKYKEVEPLLPFASGIVELEEARRRMERPDSEAAAARLTEFKAMVKNARETLAKRLEKKESRSALDTPVVGRRAAMEVDRLADAARDWLRFY
jgi:hypothetical protein